MLDVSGIYSQAYIQLFLLYLDCLEYLECLNCLEYLDYLVHLDYQH